MLWGFPWTVPWGSHDEMFQSMDVADMGLGPRVRVVPESGLPQYARLAVDGYAHGAPVYASGDQAELLGIWQYGGATGHIVNVCPQGDWPTTDIDLTAQIDAFASGRSRRISLEIAPAVGVMSNSPQLSGWSGVTGLRRFLNCMPVRSHPSWGYLRYVISDTAGVRTVTLNNGDTTIASGDLTGDGALTLFAVSSGVTGEVSITYTGDESGNVYFMWPASYKIHYTTGSGFTGTDFPRTAEATLFDNGQSNIQYWQSDVLAAATYYVVVHQVDDAGNESTGLAGGGTAATTYSPPHPPYNLAYVTGDASGTTIYFSGGSGATGYLIYDSHSGVMDLSAPTSTASDSGNQALSGITTGYSGYRYIIVRSTVGGYDDGNSDQLRIEYSGGSVVLPRPPAPGMGINTSASGRTIRVPVTVSLAEYDAVPAYVELYAWMTDTGSFASGSPLSTGTIATGSMRVGSEIVLTLSGTVAADGLYYFTARSVASSGSTSDNSEYLGPIMLTSALPAGPSSVVTKAR